MMIELAPDMPNLAGGALCLDFANSVDDRGTPREREFLGSIPQFAAWCRHAGLEVEDGAADVTLADVHQLRDAVLALASAAALGHSPPPRAVETFNRHLPSPRLLWGSGGPTLDPGVPTGSLRHALHLIAQDTVDLLTGTRRAQLRKCDRGSHCDWLFLDTTRNHTRRYCGENCATTERVLRFKRKVER